jgi:hypothetical protein
MSIIKALRYGLALPSWAHYLGSETRLKDAGKKEFIDVPQILVRYQDVYPLFMKLLGITELNQYYYEVIRRCATKYLKDEIIQRPFNISWHSGEEKDNWRISNFPEDPRWPDDNVNFANVNFHNEYNKIKERIR